MPIYEYKCNKCGNITELLLKVQDRQRYLECSCGNRMEISLTAPAGIVKGYSEKNGYGLHGK